MNRPWTACAVMLIALGGTLGALGSTTHSPIARSSPGSVLNAKRQITFCEAGLSREAYRYEDGCGFDRTTGQRYSQPRSRQPWSMVLQLHVDHTLQIIGALDERPPYRQWRPSSSPWPAVAVEIAHPSAPSFYSADAARDYALAQGQAWRASSEPLLIRQPGIEPSQSLVLIELRPSPIDLGWVYDNFSERCSRAIRTIRRYPAAHNTRITVLALEYRAKWLVDELLPTDRSELVRSPKPAFQGAASSVGLEPGEYEELVERAIERLPAPEKIESPPHFRPAPSRQKMLRMASATLQALSDLLDATAQRIEGVAAGEIATRDEIAPKR